MNLDTVNHSDQKHFLPSSGWDVAIPDELCELPCLVHERLHPCLVSPEGKVTPGLTRQEGTGGRSSGRVEPRCSRCTVETSSFCNRDVSDQSTQTDAKH